MDEHEMQRRREDARLNQELADAEVELNGSGLPTLAAAVRIARHRLFGELLPLPVGEAALSDEPTQLVLAVM